MLRGRRGLRFLHALLLQRFAVPLVEIRSLSMSGTLKTITLHELPSYSMLPSGTNTSRKLPAAIRLCIPDWVSGLMKWETGARIEMVRSKLLNLSTNFGKLVSNIFALTLVSSRVIKYHGALADCFQVRGNFGALLVLISGHWHWHIWLADWQREPFYFWLELLSFGENVGGFMKYDHLVVIALRIMGHL